MGCGAGSLPAQDCGQPPKLLLSAENVATSRATPFVGHIKRQVTCSSRGCMTSVVTEVSRP